MNCGGAILCLYIPSNCCCCCYCCCIHAMQPACTPAAYTYTSAPPHPGRRLAVGPSIAPRPSIARVLGADQASWRPRRTTSTPRWRCRCARLSSVGLEDFEPRRSGFGGLGGWGGAPQEVKGHQGFLGSPGFEVLFDPWGCNKSAPEEKAA